MAVHVVDVLEVVEVEKKHGMRPVGARRSGNRGSQFLVELAAVGKPSQRVLKRKLTRPVFGAGPPRHFPQQAPPG